MAFATPTVTSSNGASTVVGASPRTTSRYSAPCLSIRIALVVVLPQSVARMDWTSSDILTGYSSSRRRLPSSRGDFSPRHARVNSLPGEPKTRCTFGGRRYFYDQEFYEKKKDPR